MKFPQLAAIILVLLLGLVSLLLWLDNTNLSKTIVQQKSAFDSERTALTAELLSRDQTINSISTELLSTQQLLTSTESALANTENELETTQSELANKSLSLEQATEKFQELQSEISDAESSITDSLQWFNSQSTLPNSLSSFEISADTHCIDNDEVNLACLPYLMEKRLGFRYKSESSDRLFSLDEMVARKGGDCEDFSLFLKATLNSFKSKSGLSVVGWTPSTSKFIVYSDADKYWYYSGDAVDLGSLDNLYPVSFCYITDYDRGAIIGHCIVALSDKQISSVADLGHLDGAMTFEPQDGKYMGKVGSAYRICTPKTNMDCGTAPGDIMIVISDGNLYQLGDEGWYGLDQYLDDLKELKSELPINN